MSLCKLLHTSDGETIFSLLTVSIDSPFRLYTETLIKQSPKSIKLEINEI